MKTGSLHALVILAFVAWNCQVKSDSSALQQELQSINISRGEIALCGSEAKFGKVEFGLSCKETVRANFELATALLHSFEYAEAEKVFAKVMDADPECLMAYWGVAMSNFHPLWTPPAIEELEKGADVIRLARTLDSPSQKETDYLEAVAVLFDDWPTLSHQARLLKFEQAAEKMYVKYPDDKEAAVFYALALRAASDPTDKTFTKQQKAGDILNALFPSEPNHPGIAHYLIHTYDYPELAVLALPAARKYSAIASTSAHALHMPSHIFTRLGLWDEAISSNLNAVSAAQCYAENAGMEGHWDEELHGMDYLVYAYLQEGRDSLANQQLAYLRTIDMVFPLNNKVAYTFAAVPTRYAVERKDWREAAALELKPSTFPWENFPRERSLVSFGIVLGAVHLKKPEVAKNALADLQASYDMLVQNNRPHEASQVYIQIKAADGWIRFLQGNRTEAIALMTEAADKEDATDKDPITPGEVIPARELLGDMYAEMGEYSKALVAYESDLKRHPGRYNGLYGAARAAQQAGEKEKASGYMKQLETIARLSDREMKYTTVFK